MTTELAVLWAADLCNSGPGCGCFWRFRSLSPEHLDSPFRSPHRVGRETRKPVLVGIPLSLCLVLFVLFLFVFFDPFHFLVGCHMSKVGDELTKIGKLLIAVIGNPWSNKLLVFLAP